MKKVKLVYRFKSWSIVLVDNDSDVELLGDIEASAAILDEKARFQLIEDLLESVKP